MIATATSTKPPIQGLRRDHDGKRIERVLLGLRHFGGIDYAGRRTDPDAWKTAAINDLVKEIMTSIRGERCIGHRSS